MNVSELAKRAAAHNRAAVSKLRPVQKEAQERAIELYQVERGHKEYVRDLNEEREVVSGHAFDLFPTPNDLADRMVYWAYLPQYHDVPWLEPSAGTGRIAAAIKRAGHTPHCVELAYSALEILRRRGYIIVHEGSFFEFHTQYHVIVMNPPFSNLQDIDHIRHAYSLLLPGGTLVAIASESAFIQSRNKAVEFREWLDGKMTRSERLDTDVFKPSGANVATRIIQLER